MKEDVKKLLARVGQQEETLRQSPFIAPVTAGDRVAVRLPGSGLIARFRVEPADFTGWGVFQAADGNVARFERAAKLSEIERYLHDLPQFRFILAEEPEAPGAWWGVPATEDHRLDVEGIYPLLLVENVALFDPCLARFDGSRFWLEGLDTARDPALAAYLRESLSLGTPVGDLDRPGLGTRERRAYRHGLDVAVERGALSERARLIRALGHPGARLTEFSEQGSEVTVRYTMNGSEHTVRVRRDDLSVVSAGICLAGRDRDFDLASLVSVLEEAVRERPDDW
jgi:hypothetical protein